MFYMYVFSELNSREFVKAKENKDIRGYGTIIERLGLNKSNGYVFYESKLYKDREKLYYRFIIW